MYSIATCIEYHNNHFRDLSKNEFNNALLTYCMSIHICHFGTFLLSMGYQLWQSIFFEILPTLSRFIIYSIDMCVNLVNCKD